MFVFMLGCNIYFREVGNGSVSYEVKRVPVAGRNDCKAVGRDPCTFLCRVRDARRS